MDIESHGYLLKWSQVDQAWELTTYDGYVYIIPDHETRILGNMIYQAMGGFSKDNTMAMANFYQQYGSLL